VTRTASAVAADREQAAADLERAISLVGAAYRRYAHFTSELGAVSRTDFTYSLDVPIAMHFAEAGLGSLMERKLVGKVGPLRDLVARSHRALITEAS